MRRKREIEEPGNRKQVERQEDATGPDKKAPVPMKTFPLLHQRIEPERGEDRSQEPNEPDHSIGVANMIEERENAPERPLEIKIPSHAVGEAQDRKHCEKERMPRLRIGGRSGFPAAYQGKEGKQFAKRGPIEGRFPVPKMIVDQRPLRNGKSGIFPVIFWNEKVDEKAQVKSRLAGIGKVQMRSRGAADKFHRREELHRGDPERNGDRKQAIRERLNGAPRAFGILTADEKFGKGIRAKENSYVKEGLGLAGKKTEAEQKPEPDRVSPGVPCP